MNKAEQEWQAFTQLRDAFAEDIEQWQPYQGKGIYVENVSLGAGSKDAASLERIFEEVKQIKVTRLNLDVLTMLLQHGCEMYERGQENILVTFPEQTQRQRLFPLTAIERYRVVLPDGLELRHEIDRTREMSLLAAVRAKKASHLDSTRKETADIDENPALQEERGRDDE